MVRNNLIAFALTTLSCMTCALAAETGGVSTSIIPDITYKKVEKSVNHLEGSFYRHSITDNGSFIGVALVHEISNWLSLGIRGQLPMDYTGNDQVYLIQPLARFNLLNEQDVIFFETAFTQGFANEEFGGEAFAMFGVSFGYKRKFKNDFAVGLNVGADYSPTRVRTADNESYDVDILYNKLGVEGTYYF